MTVALKINEITTPNSFYRHIYPWLAKYRDKVTRSDKEHFIPIESKGSENLVKVEDLFNNPTEEQRRIFHKKWIHELFCGANQKDKVKLFRGELIKAGFTVEQAELIIEFSYDNATRAKSWATDNEKKGKIASNYMNVAVILGFIRSLVMDSDKSDVSVFENLINIAFGFSSGMRGYYQYSLYGRDDDEAAMNIYQSDIYGNKIAGSLGKSAVFCETKLNPYILTLSGLLPARFQDPVIGISLLPNLLWWRSRMPAHINQEYLTDLSRWLIHKPLALLGRGKSIEQIRDIKKRGNLDSNYFLKRHCENIGLKDKKDQTFSGFVCQLFKQVVNSFSKDPKTQLEASKKVGGTIAPFLGTTAFVSCGLGTIGRAILKIGGIKNRFFDFLASLGGATQQTIYFFKMVIKTIYDSKMIQQDINKEKTNGTVDKQAIREKESFLHKNKNLTFIGIACFLSNVINPFLKLFKPENKILNKLTGVVNMLADNLVAKFFSERRHVNGFKFRIDNPEFYNL